MKKAISFIICFAILFTVSVLAHYEGENYVLFSSTEVSIPKNQYISGDSNGDMEVNILDVITTLKYISGDIKDSRRDGIDTNGDGTVNLVDAMEIIQYLLGENTALGKLVG